MSDLMKVFISGVEEMARNLKEYMDKGGEFKSGSAELTEKIDRLTERIDKLLATFEGQIGSVLQARPHKGRRMMDIKKRMQDVIDHPPAGIRPPQIARIIGTKVQNLYPHLKSKVELGEVKKDGKSIYFPGAVKSARTRA